MIEGADRFREFFENSKDAIYVHDLKGRYTMVNPAAQKLVGYTREELLQMTIFDLVVERYFDQIQNSIKAKLINHEATIFDLEVVRKDGTRVPVEISSRLIYENDLPVGVQGTARDISERSRVEEALRGSEERFRTVTETASDAIIVINQEGMIELANPSTQKIFGYSREELLGQNLSLLMPERFQAAHSMGLERYVKTGSRTIAWEAVEVSGLRRDGSEVPLELSFGSFTKEGKRFFTGIIRDISERKRAEQALLESEERFRGLFENAKDTVFTVDLAGNFTSLNRAGEILTEYTRAEALQSHFTRVVADEYRHVAHEMISRKATGSEIATIYELEIVTKSGRHVLVEISSRTIQSGGQPIGVQGSARDITERKRAEEALKRSEEQYRILFESNPQPMCVFDLETSRFLALNEAAVGHYGYAREHFLSLTLGDLHPAEDAARLAAAQLRKIEGLRHLGEWRHRTANGETINVEMTANITNFAGRRAGLVLINDITEHKRAEEALRASQAQLQQSQKLEAIGQLAGGVAHDFNNLLTAITGYTDLSLRRLSYDDPIRRNLEEIRKTANRAASLTRQLLAFSRKQILEPKVLDLNVVVKDMYTMLRRLIGEDIDLATNATFDLGKVKADPGQVEQIILNLVVNARDAMPHGGKVTIETGNVSLDERYASEHVPVQTGDYVMLAISDTGSGMDKETQSHIFEPFFTTKEAGRGTGLGLSTVYGIVKQSGGFIWVYSELGKGTAFKIYLPLVVDEAEVGKPKLHLSPTDLRGDETILLVEDEDVVRRMARLILESRGYRVLEAREGEAALRVFCEHASQIDLMVTDVIMPGMSGRMLAERVAVLSPDLPVLYMSGYTDDAIVRHGLLGDQLEFIQKPFAPELLTRKVRSVLDSREQAGVGA
jgi:PAS domain S-box-containing protein